MREAGMRAQHMGEDCVHQCKKCKRRQACNVNCQCIWLQLGVQGILVLDARKGGPAWKSGIKGTSRDKYGRLVLGDIITAMNKKKVRTASDLYKLLDKCSIGDVIDMEVGLGALYDSDDLAYQSYACEAFVWALVPPTVVASSSRRAVQRSFEAICSPKFVFLGLAKSDLTLTIAAHLAVSVLYGF